MNRGRSKRIRVLRHQRDQRRAKESLDAISRDLDEMTLPLVEPDDSAELQDSLYAHLKKMRAVGTLRTARYSTADQAVSALLEHTSKLEGPVYSELYTGSGGSGFFLGPVPRLVLLACLQRDYEGAAVVKPDLAAGAVFDFATDDPILGDFYEVEWWV